MSDLSETLLKMPQVVICRDFAKNASNRYLPIDMLSRIFPSKFHKIHIISVSGHCMRFILFKICQSVADIRMISQFHGFFHLIFVFIQNQHDIDNLYL